MSKKSFSTSSLTCLQILSTIVLTTMQALELYKVYKALSTIYNTRRVVSFNRVVKNLIELR